MKRGAGFTLIELLIVISIIALLVAMLVPALAYARGLARKAVCSSNLDTYSVALTMYLAEYSMYPPMGAHPAPVPVTAGGAVVPMWYGYGFPKINGVLHANRITGTHKHSNYAIDAYLWEADEVWEGAVCAGMDAMRMWQMLDAAADAGRVSYDGKPAMYKAATSYQWNPTLRSPNIPIPVTLPSGRWPNKLWDPWGTSGWDNVWWIDHVINLPSGSYVAQAIRPEEIFMPQEIAEAWDSWDHGSAPGVNIQTSWATDNMYPGWHCGPMSRGTNGWALLNAARHPAGPNILYADSHVASDANKEINPSDLGPCPAGSWDGLKAVSWGDYMDDPDDDRYDFGTMWHICPRREFMAD